MTTGAGRGPRRAVGLLLAALPLLLPGCGAPVAGEAGGVPTAPMLATPRPAATAGPCTFPPKGPKPPPSPTVDNRSTEERSAEYMAGFNDFMARRARWIEDFQAAGKDAGALCRVPVAASYAPGPPSLTAALRQADLVVEGAVTTVVYTPAGTVDTVRIVAVHKVSDSAEARLGTARPTEIQITLGYSPEPDSTFSLDAGRLAFRENQPVLLPGARAMLFLQVSQMEHLPPFAMQSFTGGYEIDAGGRIVPVPDNPFAAQVRGMPAEQFAALIARELGATTDGSKPTSGGTPAPSPSAVPTAFTGGYGAAVTGTPARSRTANAPTPTASADMGADPFALRALAYTRERVTIRSGTPTVRLSRPVTSAELRVLGIGSWSFAPGCEPPLHLVILHGDFDVRPSHPASLAPGAQIPARFVAYLYDADATEMIAMMSDPSGASFKRALGDPDLPDATSSPGTFPAGVPCRPITAPGGPNRPGGPVPTPARP